MKNKYITENERYQIEILVREGRTPKEIARLTGRCLATIYNELKRGEITLMNSDLTEYTTYRADVAQRIHEENVSNKGRDLKIGNDYAFVAHVENKIINEKFSPYAVLQEIKNKGLEFKTEICETTLYNYIHAGLFMNIKMEHMPSPRKAHKSHVKVKRRALNRLKGKTIEERPADIKLREDFGHWEMDTVYSQQTKKTTLLVLTERKGRGEYIIRMKSRTAAEVKKALDRLERTLTPKGFREVFKTITCDNGSEFADSDLMEKSCINKKIPRTVLYYCHPYSSWERGSNENNNRFIRRWIKKGEDIGDYSEEEIQKIQNWVNDYPRRIFDGLSANQFSQDFHTPINK